ncbi:MAG: M1 family metallopeptidase [Chloroflexaceae bacterium]|nr:M1 family metallopeptidase [Chloroflexaceae bacterium]NJO04092.1 M1 family metallopeptidase [Chloroflexaceae bacterium]
MHRATRYLLFVLLLAACAAPVAQPTAPPVPVAEQPGRAADIAMDTPSPAPAFQPEPTPTAPPPTMPPPTSTLPPTATPTPTLIDVAAQAAALVPEYASDLAQAEAWDQYALYVVLDPAALTLYGELDLALRNREEVPYTELYFKLYPNEPIYGGSLSVSEVLVNDQPATFATEQDTMLLRVDLTEPLPPAAEAIVSIRFETRTPRNASGSTFGAFNQEAGVWALANFYPTLARRFNGSWDTRPLEDQGDLPATETALYAVTIDTPPEWTVVATGVRTDQTPLDHGPRREYYVSGPQREFFIAALRDLDQASTVVDGTRVVSYYQRGNPAAGQASLQIAADSVRIFNARFGRYPLAELDVIQAALTKFLGMEFPGVVLIEQRLYPRGGRVFETTVVHEVAHQWWYSQVGSDPQGEPWLDESLASYLQVVYYEGIGNPQAATAEVDFFRQQYIGARNTGRDGIVSGPAGSFNGNYVAMVYAKGALFYQALRQRLGDERFFAFLQTYYATYRYEEATGADVLRVAEETCSCDLQQFYTDWIARAVAVDVP